MKMTSFVASLILGVVACSGLAYAQSDTEKEVKQTIVENFEYRRANLKERPDVTVSKHGELSFYSSGGLMNESGPGAKPEELDAYNLHPKHIKVITLVEGQAAVALYYSEGSVKRKGAPLVGHYLTRVTEVFVKEDGKWKARSGHFSPVTGGSGTTITAPTPEQ